jgi:hypothetical protein
MRTKPSVVNVRIRNWRFDASAGPTPSAHAGSSMLQLAVVDALAGSLSPAGHTPTVREVASEIATRVSEAIRATGPATDEGERR